MEKLFSGITHKVITKRYFLQFPIFIEGNRTFYTTTIFFQFNANHQECAAESQ